MPVPAMPGASAGGGGAAQAVTRYHALFESVRSRRRKPETLKGLDAIASQGLVRLKNRKVTLRWLRAHAEQTERIGAGLKNHSDAALNEVMRELREVFRRGRQDDAAVQRALAAVREVGRRETGEEAFTVQLMGALALYHGRIVEMLTGEGKTLTGSLVAPLLAWRHRYLHVFTVNDYLAARDAASRRGIYRRCGCDVGAITQQLEPGERWGVYAKPIVYGTPKQITADYLRDQLRLGEMRTPWAGRRLLAMRAGVGGSGGGAGPMIPGLRACLVDEADAVLIDEGVVPLIIARARREDEMSGVYREGALIAVKLDEGADYTMDQLKRRAELTRRGRHRALAMCSELTDAIWRAERRAEELIRQALVARHCYLRGQQYEIVDGRVVIVDEYTGRFLADRSWEHGLHQAVEAKEGVEVTADRETLARISFQRFFRMYPFLCGMTGTAPDARGEIERVYERPVTIVPTNRPLIRQKWPMRIFRTAEAKWTAIVSSIQELHEQGRPVLVGTRSIETSELLSAKLEARGLTHRVLNANFDKDEAEMIVGAG
jgi:preprotein translocase subunit SecA